MCTWPTFDAVTKLTRCAEGYSFRPEAIACGVAPSGAAGSGGDGGQGGQAQGGQSGQEWVECTTDAECDHLLLGHCRETCHGEWMECEAGCYSDDDCAADEVCRCDGSATFGVCAPADCRSDADCEPTYHCMLSGYGVFDCQRPEDACNTDADCDLGEECFVPSESGEARVCVRISACGRPFLVSREQRLASVTTGDSWLEPAASAPSTEGLSAAERERLAAHWARLGLMEHASIAAFARFSLQLLALGAPAELVEACTRAMADETRHTKLCFGIASAYAGAPIGPSTLNVADSLEGIDLRGVLRLVVLEGCLGETVATLEAADDAEAAVDPYLRAVLSQIAADERRHAELAFRFVRWALDRGGSPIARYLEQLIARELRFGEPGEWRTQLTNEVVVPCLHALIERSAF